MKLNDLEQYRDEEGYIDIDQLLQEHDLEKLHEVRGSSNREKDWLQLEDTSVLLRSQGFENEDVRYTNYAELIIEELAKQVGIPCAHYDLIKYNGKKGVLSENVITDDNESLITCDVLLDAMGIPHQKNAPININDIFMAFRGLTKYDDVSKKNIQELNRSLAKVAIFDVFTMATDRHTGNLGIKFSGNNQVMLSPIFDNECSLMLDQPESEIQLMLFNKKYASQIASLQNQMLVVDEEDRELDNNGVTVNLDWEDMMYYLCDNSDEFMKFAEKCAHKMHLGKALDSVEERIHAPIPEELKLHVTRAFNNRKSAIEKDLIIEEVAI